MKHFTHFYLFKMIAFAIVVMSLSTHEAKSQCPCDNTIWLTWAAPTIIGNSVTTTCIYAGEFCRVTGMAANNEYRVYTCGNTAFDTQITIYPFGSCVSAGYNDDACGPWQSEIWFQPAASGDYDMLVDEFNCISNPTCMDLTVELTCIASTAPTGITVSQNPTCPGNLIQLTKTGGSLGTGSQWEWYTGSCGGIWFDSGINVGVTPSVTTTYYVRAEGTCYITACAGVTVVVNTNSTAPTGIAVSQNPTCPGNVIQLTKQGGSLGTGAQWEWYTGSCGNNWFDQGMNIGVAPTVTTTYYVRAEGTCNTTTCASVTVTVNTNSTAPSSASANPSTICSGNSTTLTKSGGSLGSGASWEWYSGSCGGTPVGSGSPISVSPSSTTTYYVRAEGACNTTTCASVTVTVDPLPGTASVTGNSNPPAGNQTYTASASGNPTSWDWTCPPGWNCSGCTGASCLMTVNTNSGNICATPSNACGNGLQGCLPNVIGVKEVVSINNLYIFPNPNKGEFVIEMELAKPLDLKIELFNVIGQVIYKEEGKYSGKYQKAIDLPGIKSGVYFLNVETEEGTIRKKVVIE